MLLGLRHTAWIEHQKALRAEGLEVSSNQSLLKASKEKLSNAFSQLEEQVEGIEEALEDLTDKDKYNKAAQRRGNS